MGRDFSTFHPVVSLSACKRKVDRKLTWHNSWNRLMGLSSRKKGMIRKTQYCQRVWKHTQQISVRSDGCGICQAASNLGFTNCNSCFAVKKAEYQLNCLLQVLHNSTAAVLHKFSIYLSVAYHCSHLRGTFASYWDLFTFVYLSFPIHMKFWVEKTTLCIILKSTKHLLAQNWNPKESVGNIQWFIQTLV